MKKRTCLTVAVLLLAACANVPAQPLPQITFANLQPIPINVASVNVHVTSSRTGGAFIADPASVAESYMKQRYAPHGYQGSLDATIEEATVTTEEKKSANNVARFFNVDNTDVYNITLRIRFEHLAGNGQPLYGKVITARRKLAISEHESIAARERYEFKSIENMFRELDQQVSVMVTEGMRLGM